MKRREKGAIQHPQWLIQMFKVEIREQAGIKNLRSRITQDHVPPFLRDIRSLGPICIPGSYDSEDRMTGYALRQN